MDYFEASKFVAFGKTLSTEDIKNLETVLTQNIDNLELRLKLLGAYQKNWARYRTQYFDQLVWLISNYADNDITHIAVIPVVKSRYPATYKRLRMEWFKHFDLKPLPARTVLNTASFCFVNLDYIGLSPCLDILESAEFDKTDFLSAASLYERVRSIKDIDSAKLLESDLALERAVKWARQAVKYDESGNEYLYASIRLTSLAFDAGLSEAEELANALLQKAQENPQRLSYAEHVANTVLGKIALTQGNVTSAIQYLQKSVLCLFDSAFLYLKGPDLTLANELFKLGENEATTAFAKQLAMLSISHEAKILLKNLDRNALEF